MITRTILKTLLQQYLQQQTDVVNFFSGLGLSTQNQISEYGQRRNITDFVYPLVSWKVISIEDIDGCTTCEKKKVVFDIYIESRKDTTDESDLLLEVLEDSVMEDCGLSIGAYSETPEFELIVGTGNEVRVWSIDKVSEEQVVSEGQGLDNSSGSQSNGRLIFSMLRFEMVCA